MWRKWPSEIEVVVRGAVGLDCWIQVCGNSGVADQMGPSVEKDD